MKARTALKLIARRDALKEDSKILMERNRKAGLGRHRTRPQKSAPHTRMKYTTGIEPRDGQSREDSQRYVMWHTTKRDAFQNRDRNRARNKAARRSRKVNAR